MARPKGSKNRSTVEIEQLQEKIIQLEKQHNSYDEVVDAFVEGFVMDLYGNDIIKKVSLEKLQEWFSNPDKYMEQITNLLTYYYIVDGNIFQLYDLIFSLPQLDYKVTVLDKSSDYRDDLIQIKRILDKKIKHKELTRDLLVQLAHEGTLLGTWCGGSKNPYFYTFNNLKYIYPYGRLYHNMVGVIDLQWLDDMTDEERNLIYQNLKPIVTQKKYDKFKNNSDSHNEKELRYIMLPPDKSLVARTHTLNRNQRLGVPWGTQSLFDLQHKSKLKDLEKAIADKIIRAIAVLKFRGKDDNEIKVRVEDKKKVYAGVKKALQKNNSGKDSITCIALPDFSSLEFPELKNGEKALDPKKYESIDNDITSATGISSVLTNGMKGNYASAQLNLQTIYKKIGVLLEQVEEIYNQLINIVLGERGENYIFEYNKDFPLTKKEKIDVLMRLHNMEGFSLKFVIDQLDVDWQDYIDQSIYEQETLKLQEKIKPYASAYTGGFDGINGGSPTKNNPTNDSTIQDKSQGGNQTPRADI